jgi:glycosyltransferase involved in cell wall biosynthesis
VKPLKILHNAPTIGPTSFGIGQIAISLAQAQNELNQNVTVWCLDNIDNIKWASNTHGFPLEFIKRFKLFGPKSMWYSPAMKKRARGTPQGIFDVVHQHGIWTGSSSATLIFSQKQKIPTVIAPHGSLNKWVINYSRWKKMIALSAYERSNLQLASCLHATSQSEISDFRDYGLKNPIAYIENGIQEKYLSVKGNAKNFRQQYSIDPDKHILLFLSRISPKKGLPMLVEAINFIGADFANWLLIIAGIDEFDHKKDVETQIKQLNLEDKIRIIGPLFDQAKKDAFEAADLFILPSYSEGSPMVVLDSLAAGVPVITTIASSWNDLTKFKCGWWTDINTSAIAIALKEAVSMNAEDLKKMGENAKKLIELKYTWPRLAQKTISLYNWLLGLDEKPDFIVLD